MAEYRIDGLDGTLVTKQVTGRMFRDFNKLMSVPERMDYFAENIFQKIQWDTGETSDIDEVLDRGSEVILACMGVWDDGLGKAARKLFKPGL